MRLNNYRKKTYRYLEKIGGMVGLDLPYFVGGGFYTILSQIGSALTGFVTTIFLTRYLTTVDYGQYQYVLSILGTLSFLSLPGMNIALTRVVPLGFEKTLVLLTKQRVFGSLLLSLVLIMLSGYYYLNNNLSLFKIFLVISLLTPFYYPFSISEIFLQAKKLFKTVSVFIIVKSLIVGLGVIIVAIYTKSAFYSLLAFIGMESFFNVLFYGKSKLMIVSKRISNQAVKTGYFFTGLYTISIIASFLDKVILGRYLGLQQLAIYSVASIFPLAVANVIKSLMHITSIKLIGQDEQLGFKSIKVHLGKLLLMGIMASISGMVIFPYLIGQFFPAIYYQAKFYSLILSLLLLLAPLNDLLVNVVVYQKDYRANLPLAFYPAIPKILLSLWLIPQFGISGVIGVVLLEQILLMVWLGRKFLF